MKFILEPGQTEGGNNWWQIDAKIGDLYLVYNFCGGYHYISKKEYDAWEKIEVNHWYALPNFMTPYLTYDLHRDLWIGPDGTKYGTSLACHTEVADMLVEFFEWEDDKHLSINESDDILTNKGFIRLSVNFWTQRLEEMTEWKMTSAQSNAVFDWCQKWNIKYPADIIEII